MVKHIAIQSIFQIAVLLFLVLYGQRFLPEYADEYDNLIGADLSAKYFNGQPDGTMAGGLFHPLLDESYEPHFLKYHVYSRHLTFVFNVFVFLQVFNFFSCRKINDELDLFSGLGSNPIFWLMLSFIIVFQWSIIYFLNVYFKCYNFRGLTIQQWLLSLLIGFMVVPLSIVIRLLPFAKPEQAGGVNDLANDLVFREPEEETEDFGVEKM